MVVDCHARGPAQRPWAWAAGGGVVAGYPFLRGAAGLADPGQILLTVRRSTIADCSADGYAGALIVHYLSSVVISERSAVLRCSCHAGNVYVTGSGVRPRPRPSRCSLC